MDSIRDSIERLVCEVDVAYLDGTFFSADELPNRDMAAFPHPLITHTMLRLSSLSATERAKVRFIHLNHTNPALHANSKERQRIRDAGFGIAEEMERFDL
jgi:pyrroloquinoline quinone biosynthesis protein B